MSRAGARDVRSASGAVQEDGPPGNLPIGAYQIAVEIAGFQQTISNLTIGAAEKGRQDFTLAVGTVSTIATVEAAAPLLFPNDAPLGSTVVNKYATEYPLLLRSWDDLEKVVARVQVRSAVTRLSLLAATYP